MIYGRKNAHATISIKSAQHLSVSNLGYWIKYKNPYYLQVNLLNHLHVFFSLPSTLIFKCTVFVSDFKKVVQNTFKSFFSDRMRHFVYEMSCTFGNLKQAERSNPKIR